MITLETLEPLVKEGLGDNWLMDESTSLCEDAAGIVMCTLVVRERANEERVLSATGLIDPSLHVRSQVKILVDEIREALEAASEQRATA